ncbi:MAG: hypothetical protein U0930_20575 [Pirellulales bacterium]
MLSKSKKTGQSLTSRRRSIPVLIEASRWNDVSESVFPSIVHAYPIRPTTQMTSTPVERVRQAISSHLARLSGTTVASLHESILIRNGLYCGRKFQAVGYEVVWFVEEDEIKFFGPCGSLLHADSVITFLDKEQPAEVTFHRRAA